MSVGDFACCRKIAGDENRVEFEYACCDIATDDWEQAKETYDGKIIVDKDAFVEPEIREKLKRMPSGRKKIVIKRIRNDVDFEIYRDKKQSDKRKDGYIGYRDEVSLCFTGITDSYIPKIEIPITYLYNEAHMLPTERLYKYLIEKYFSGKKFKREGLDYGALCLFG